LVNSRKLKAIIRISASVGAMRRSPPNRIALELPTDQKPWRLEDLAFESMGDDQREKATIDGVEIVRQDGRYWINSPYGQWSDLDENEVEGPLMFLFGKRQGGQ